MALEPFCTVKNRLPMPSVLPRLSLTVQEIVCVPFGERGRVERQIPNRAVRVRVAREHSSDVRTVDVISRVTARLTVHVDRDCGPVGRDRATRRNRPSPHHVCRAGRRPALRGRVDRAERFDRGGVVRLDVLGAEVCLTALGVDRVGVEPERSVAAGRASVDQVGQHVRENHESPARAVVERRIRIEPFDVWTRSGDDRRRAEQDHARPLVRFPPRLEGCRRARCRRRQPPSP